METIIIKNSKNEKIIFKGQYYTALKKLFEGKTVDINDFNNGSWEPTSNISHFIGLLKISELWEKFKIAKNGNSLRNADIKICEYYYMLINDIYDLDYRNTNDTIVKYYFDKNKFYLFKFDKNINKYDSIQVTIDYKNNNYSIWGIKGTNAELLDNNFLNYFDSSILYCAEKTEIA